jgi:hypothetical protein
MQTLHHTLSAESSQSRVYQQLGTHGTASLLLSQPSHGLQQGFGPNWGLATASAGHFKDRSRPVVVATELSSNTTTGQKPRSSQSPRASTVPLFANPPHKSRTASRLSTPPAPDLACHPSKGSSRHHLRAENHHVCLLFIGPSNGTHL